MIEGKVTLLDRSSKVEAGEMSWRDDILLWFLLFLVQAYCLNWNIYIILYMNSAFKEGTHCPG